MRKLYFEATDLLRDLLKGEPLTGISRVAFHSLHALLEDGVSGIHLLVYDRLFRCYRSQSAQDWSALFNVGKARSRSSQDSPNWHKRIIQTWPKAKIGQDDVLFYSGNWWWRPAAFDAFTQLKVKSGATLAVFLHDLIPVYAPAYIEPSQAKLFRHGLRKVFNAADLLITNSNASQADILRYMQEQALPVRPVFVTPLAHEFLVQGHHAAKWWRRDKSDQELKVLQQAIGTRHFTLMVGTIEKRKNQLAVLKAWSDRWSKESHSHCLVLAGRWGQGAGEIKEMLHATKNMNGTVLIINKVTDRGLRWLYTNCSFTIYVSSYEGWGLPVGESLWFDKPVLTSNLSAMPEAGEGLAHYVDPSNHEHLVAQIEQLISNPSLPPQNTKVLRKLRSVEDFGRNLHSKLEQQSLT